jgi:hypothetical protein
MWITPKGKACATNKIALPPPGTATALFVVMIAALPFIAMLDVGPLVGIGADANAILTLLAALVFVVAHGYIALGWRNIIAFSLITVVISFTSEAIGVATGLIFGAYHYTDLLGPSGMKPTSCLNDTNAIVRGACDETHVPTATDAFAAADGMKPASNQGGFVLLC